MTSEQHFRVTTLLAKCDKVSRLYRENKLGRDRAMTILHRCHSEIDSIKGLVCRCLACREKGTR